MKVAVFGTGAIGGYIGGLLGLDGHELHLIARGAHLKAIQARGLTLRDVVKDEIVQERVIHAPATDDPATIGPVDLVLFGVKAFDTVEAGAQCAPLMGPDTALLTIQNGLDAPEQLAAIYGAERILAGSTGYTATVTAPGVIARFPPSKNIPFAEMSGTPRPRTQAIADALTHSGSEGIAHENAQVVLYTKFLFLASIAAITASSRGTYGEVFTHPPTRALYNALVDEIAAVATAEGVPLTPEIIAGRKEVNVSLGGTQFKSSLQRDFEKGRRTELDVLLGTVVRRGRQHGVPTPRFETLYALLSLAREFGYRYNGNVETE